MKFLPILLVLVAIMTLAPLMYAQPLQLCHDNGTYTDDVVITACLDKASYNVGDSVQVQGFFRANKLVTPNLPNIVGLAWYFDLPNGLNYAFGRFTVPSPNYDFAFTLTPNSTGDWQLTIVTEGMGHNALQFTIPVESPLTTITTQVPFVSTVQITAKSTTTIVSNSLVTGTKIVVLVIPEFSSVAIVAFSALAASLFLIRRVTNR